MTSNKVQVMSFVQQLLHSCSRTCFNLKQVLSFFRSPENFSA